MILNRGVTAPVMLKWLKEELTLDKNRQIGWTCLLFVDVQDKTLNCAR